MSEMINGHHIVSEMGDGYGWCEDCEQAHDLRALRAGHLGALEEAPVLQEDDGLVMFDRVWRYAGHEVSGLAARVHADLLDQSRERADHRRAVEALMDMVLEGTLSRGVAQRLGVSLEDAREAASQVFTAMKPYLVDAQLDDVMDGIIERL